MVAGACIGETCDCRGRVNYPARSNVFRPNISSIRRGRMMVGMGELEAAHAEAAGRGILGQSRAGASELDRRLAHLGRRPSVDLARMLDEARAAVADDMSSSVQFGSEFEMAEAAHRKWQQIHRYVQRIPFRDDTVSTRPAQWPQALAKIRVLDDLDLIECPRRVGCCGRRLGKVG